MALTEVITLYDIPGEVEGKTWSANTWKARFALSYKGLAYQTVWIEYSDIEGVCKSISAMPTRSKPDGSGPLYTPPTIYDPQTKTYPDMPRLIPAEADALYAAFEEAFTQSVMMKMIPLTAVPTYKVLHPSSAAYFARAKELETGLQIQEFSPDGAIRERQLQEAFAKISQWMSMDGTERQFFMGDKTCYADITWDGGRWGRFMEYFEQYAMVDA